MKITVRIFVLITLLCSGAIIGINQMMVWPRIKGIEDTRDANLEQRDRETSEKTRAQSDLARTRDEQTTTKAALDAATQQLADKTQEAARESQRVNQLQAAKRKVEDEYATWQRDFAEFEELRRTPEQIMKTEADLKKTTAERNTLTGENKLLAANLKKVDTDNQKLKKQIFPADWVELPADLVGKVVAVDPKYQFVVLNIGKAQGVRERAEMVVNRNGMLVGKVRIMEVAADHCVANILQTWRKSTKDDVMEGDRVLVENKL